MVKVFCVSYQGKLIFLGLKENTTKFLSSIIFFLTITAEYIFVTKLLNTSFLFN